MIVSLSGERSIAVCKQLGKVAAVRINDVEALKDVLEAQSGRAWTFAPVEYTLTARRSHLLKSTEDSWQREHRLFTTMGPFDPIAVVLPPGIAEPIDLGPAT